MSQVVEVNGVEYEFPDDMTDEQIRAAIAKESSGTVNVGAGAEGQGSAAPPPRMPIDRVLDLSRGAAAGAASTVKHTSEMIENTPNPVSVGRHIASRITGQAPARPSELITDDMTTAPDSPEGMIGYGLERVGEATLPASKMGAATRALVAARVPAGFRTAATALGDAGAGAILGGLQEGEEGAALGAAGGAVAPYVAKGAHHLARRLPLNLVSSGLDVKNASSATREGMERNATLKFGPNREPGEWLGKAEADEVLRTGGVTKGGRVSGNLKTAIDQSDTAATQALKSENLQGATVDISEDLAAIRADAAQFAKADRPDVANNLGRAIRLVQEHGGDPRRIPVERADEIKGLLQKAADSIYDVAESNKGYPQAARRVGSAVRKGIEKAAPSVTPFNRRTAALSNAREMYADSVERSQAPVTKGSEGIIHMANKLQRKVLNPKNRIRAGRALYKATGGEEFTPELSESAMQALRLSAQSRGREAMAEHGITPADDVELPIAAQDPDDFRIMDEVYGGPDVPPTIRPDPLRPHDPYGPSIPLKPGAQPEMPQVIGEGPIPELDLDAAEDIPTILARGEEGAGGKVLVPQSGVGRANPAARGVSRGATPQRDLGGVHAEGYAPDLDPPYIAPGVTERPSRPIPQGHPIVRPTVPDPAAEAARAPVGTAVEPRPSLPPDKMAKATEAIRAAREVTPPPTSEATTTDDIIERVLRGEESPDVLTDDQFREYMGAASGLPPDDGLSKLQRAARSAGMSVEEYVQSIINNRGRQ
jgi:hypothetical protein